MLAIVHLRVPSPLADEKPLKFCLPCLPRSFLGDPNLPSPSLSYPSVSLSSVPSPPPHPRCLLGPAFHPTEDEIRPTRSLPHCVQVRDPGRRHDGYYVRQSDLHDDYQQLTQEPRSKNSNRSRLSPEASHLLLLSSLRSPMDDLFGWRSSGCSSLSPMRRAFLTFLSLESSIIADSGAEE